MAHYAWIITEDLYADEEYPEGTNMNAPGVAGPHDATDEQIELARKEGFVFRMLDDDGNVMYKGRLYIEPGNMGGSPEAVTYPDFNRPVCRWAVDEEAGFGPLNDFGTPNAGATEIQYRSTNINGDRVWATL
jgi:hypothetical protein